MSASAMFEAAGRYPDADPSQRRDGSALYARAVRAAKESAQDWAGFNACPEMDQAIDRVFRAVIDAHPDPVVRKWAMATANDT